MSIEKKKTYAKAINKWGIDTQIIMVFEEMAELQKELCKNLRREENRVKIAEEIADVEIMLEQMKQYFNIEEGVNRYRHFKLKRLEGNLR